MKTGRNVHIASLLTACLVALAAIGFTQTETAKAQRERNPVRGAAGPSAVPSARRNPKVARMLAEIDARNIERTIRKLVSFGTRNTLSVQDNPARGIGAARDWLYQEFQKIAAQTGGRMTVEKQSYEEAANPPPRGRVPKPTMVTNVV